MIRFFTFTLLFCTALLPISGVVAQTTIINPNTTGSFTTPSDWTITTSTTSGVIQPNAWVIGSVPTPTGFSGNSAYVSNNGSSWVYTYANASPSASSASYLYRDVTFPSGETDITLSMDVSLQGGSGDGIQVGLMTTSTALKTVSTNPFSTTIPVAPNTATDGVIVGAYYYNLWGSATQSQRLIIKIPASAAGNCAGASTKRLVISWVNDNTAGTGLTERSVAIDNVSLVSATASAFTPGTYTINNTLATGGTNFNNFTDAINKLNAAVDCGGTITGAYTFNVSAGQTFSEYTPALTANGTATNFITFQRSGAGANPIIKPTAREYLLDWGICLQGADYVTFDGIDVGVNKTEGAFFEYGYLIRGNSSTDGAQYNIIKNTTIELDRNIYATAAQSGIFQSVTTHSISPTSAAGTNSYNKFLDFKIRKAVMGIQCFGGATTFYETGTEIGTATPNAIPATFSEIGSDERDNIGSDIVNSTIYGVNFLSGSSGVKVHHVIVRNLVSSSIVNGISLGATLGTNEVYNNKVYNLRSMSQTTGSVVGISVSQPTTSAGHETRVYNNFVSNLNHETSVTSSTSYVLRGIEVGSGNAGGTYNIYNNTVSVKCLAPNAISTAFVYTSLTPKVVVMNNIFANTTDAQTGAYRHFCTIATNTATTSTSSAFGAAGTALNYNGFYLPNTGGGNIGSFGLYSTAANNKATLANWKATVGLVNAVSYSPDANSFEANPNFLSATDLHTGASAFDGTGTTLPAWLTTDIDNQTRTGAADVGADDFTLPSADLAASDLVSPVVVGCANASQGVTVSVKNMGSSPIDFSVTPATVTCNVTGSATAMLSETVSTGTLAAGASQNVALIGTFNMSASGTYSFSSSVALTGDGNAANNVATTSRNVSTTTFAMPYSQDFGATSSSVSGWYTGGTAFSVNYTGGLPQLGAAGVVGSALYRQVNTSNTFPYGYCITPKMGTVASGDYIAFDWKVVIPATASPYTPAVSPNWGNFKVDISTDCGNTFTTLQTVNADGVGTTNYTNLNIPLTSYVGQEVMFRIGLTSTTPTAATYYIFDNFVIGQPAPANNECANAVTISSTATSGTTIGATAVPTATTPTCDASASSISDVWYKFNTGTGASQIYNTDVAITSVASGKTIEYAVYKGTCAAMYEMAGTCGSTTGANASVTLRGMEPNRDYYVRVWSNSTPVAGTFDIALANMITASSVVLGNATTTSACQAATSVVINAANANTWVPVMDGANLVAEINANGQALGTVNVNYFINGTGTIRTASGSTYLDRNFGFSSTSTFASPVSLRLYMTNGERTTYSTATGGDPVSVTHYAGAGCSSSANLLTTDPSLSLISATISTANNGGAYMELNTPSFSGFYVGPNTLLPIELKAFKATALNNQNKVEWTTASERNTKKFIVERANDGVQNWQIVATVAAAGNSTKQVSYQIFDQNPTCLAFYRLRSVDLDEKEAISSVVSAQRRCGRLAIAAIYPNPANANATLTFEATQNDNVTVTLTDLLGKIVRKQQQNAVEGFNKMELNLENVPQGTYFITIQDQNAKVTKRIVKQ